MLPVSFVAIGLISHLDKDRDHNEDLQTQKFFYRILKFLSDYYSGLWKERRYVWMYVDNM